MTPDQFRETLTQRRAEIDAESETVLLEIKKLDDRYGTLVMRSNELSWALEQLDAAPVVAEPVKAPEQAPRDKAAEMIEGCFAADYPLPENIDELPVMIRDSFTVRTLRAALNIAHARRNKSRAALPSAEHVPNNRKDEGTASLIPDDPQGGAGADDTDMPAFLRREKAAAE